MIHNPAFILKTLLLNFKPEVWSWTEHVLFGMMIFVKWAACGITTISVERNGIRFDIQKAKCICKTYLLSTASEPEDRGCFRVLLKVSLKA